ncbi:exo-beta-N-acetylmuramidase NamZ family protein [Capnocytophaga catalasegens]|uniref:DUF1343 domain-containing protein n=1 Tax=Capnocytophaga catalasegens TaxID=1004260 RepID=A0AAV5AWS1_9FLAO|nr:DUF1343 domain-containing protein [Capnocytophaga catalasegens]GIZ15262.1 hypothetical protein RCZ03_12620 [Capnocytophaga catalasegens]GJM49776.1 hypothetical protein RCZ15_07510 [Capnocytophaga catalasegens]GJM52841.1 hypothetical protein RCZ16_11580 [Capnocytophaga catalasegens]
MFRKSKSTLFLAIILISCQNSAQKVTIKENVAEQIVNNQIVVGANRLQEYLPQLLNKKVGVVTNHTGVLLENNQPIVHIVDTLLHQNIQIIKVFAPEHGFRGDADAGEIIKDGRDTKTNLPIISLYAKNKKPTQQQLSDIDIVLFDIQDVGVRFYTYISTLHYVMEACAENNKPLIVLDRPNPNGHYIDGAVLEQAYESFVGMHPVPVVYGMTIGEYARMINGEKWLKGGVQCQLMIVPLENYTHVARYSLPVRPSPNLPNDISVNLYPSLCFFEGTNVSVGRGTDKQFQIYGSPYLHKTDFQFVPQSNKGAKEPLYKGKVCYGEDVSQTPYLSALNLSWLIKAYKQTSGVKTTFFNNFFNKLAGNATLRNQIENNVSEEEIRKSWQKDLDKFKNIRQKYLLYE